MKKTIYSIVSLLLLTACGSTNIVSIPIENIDNTPLKVTELTKDQEKTWGHLDLIKDTVPGMSVDKAYNELLKNKKGKKVIVAVIDSGIDIDHEDLDGVIWTNDDEVPNNGKDDDNNGFVDDIHGWNFLGDSYNEQLEFVRILAKNDTSNPDYGRAQKDFEKEYNETVQTKQNVDQLVQIEPQARAIIKQHLGKEDFTEEDVKKITSADQAVAQSKGFYMFLYENGLNAQKLKDAATDFADRLNYNLKKDFNGRTPVGDNPYDIGDSKYGNGNVKPVKKSESHGTHVAGIIAAERNNGKGVNGVANNVEIMAIRAVPNGDEYDKDIALAIRYAVDNGAKIINTSFGKYYSPNADWVYDAIKYAASKDVLIVNAAGNESYNLDDTSKTVFPNDQVANGKEIANNFLSVGALANTYGGEMVASFSNYGKINVDVFAPGDDIYSTMPENEYEFQGGTSMAAPATAGVAALMRSYYPNLSATQVKDIIMRSGLPVTTKVVVGEAKEAKPFSDISSSGKMVNAYNALVLASKTK
ncbi:S8 family peptidase [Spongiivirga sp. MCCC 1A20706]|uniref:S8 family peptidase n=1 Tax=Spongiivirga sp. MCCC 1A20706 TaxID=3160963 RepID=UPI0039774234